MGIFWLPSALQVFRKEYPEVDFELVISNAVTNLSKRDADIALRMFEPQQPDLVSRRLADVEFGLYCHKDYLAEVGPITRVEDLSRHTMIGFDQGQYWLNKARKSGFPLSESDFNYKTDNLVAQYALILAGCGIGGMNVQATTMYPQLTRILEDIVVIEPLQCWIVCHREVQYNSRIRILMQFLGDWFDTKLCAEMAVKF